MGNVGTIPTASDHILGVCIRPTINTLHHLHVHVYYFRIDLKNLHRAFRKYWMNFVYCQFNASSKRRGCFCLHLLLINDHLVPLLSIG